MKEEKFSQTINNTDEELRARSDEKFIIKFVVRGMIAAGIILLACVGAYLIIQNMNKASNTSGPTSIIVNDVAYSNSWSTAKECPVGFEYGGTVSLAKGGGDHAVLNCNYYTDAEIPEWMDDCVLAGSAHLEEPHRIPKTELGVNGTQYDKSSVYADPDDSEVLYISTSWHTATDEEKKDTLHNGYDVFVLYTLEAAE